MARRVGRLTAEGYQERIAGEVAAAVRARRSGMVLAPTGSGKSLLAAMAVEDCAAMGLPVLLLQPSIDLLRQNVVALRSVPSLIERRVGLFVAKNERAEGIGATARDTLETGIALATFASITNKRDDARLRAEVRAFGAKGGVVIVDEGQGAAAEGLGKVLEAAHAAGAVGIGLSATPIRTDGQDPMRAFGVAPGASLVAVAEHVEVLRTGRTVPTRFELAGRELRRRLGAGAMDVIDDAFEELVAQGRSVEQASEEAFGRLFKPSASEAEARLGASLLSCLADVWQARAPGRSLAMVHCDSVAMARALVPVLGARTMPPSHERAGRHVRVGYVDAKGVMVSTEGVDRTTVALGWTKAEARSRLIAGARRGDYDVLVNVVALGVGTDIPLVDLTVIAAYRTGLGMLKQRSGRAERSSQGKSDQLLVDVGSSVLRHYLDVRAVDDGDVMAADPSLRDVDVRILRQFKQWFDGDPDLAAAVEEVRRARREGAEREEPVDAGDAVGDGRPGRPRPTRVALGPHAWAASAKRHDRHTSQFVGKLGVAVDLGAAGLVSPEANLPGVACLVRDHAGLATARGFVRDDAAAEAFMLAAGVGTAASGEPASPKQTAHARSMARDPRNGARGLLSLDGGPLTKAQASSAIDAFRFAPEVPRALLAGLGDRALCARGLDHPVATVAFDAFGRIPAGRVAAIRDYVAACGRLAPGSRRPTLAVADPLDRDAVAEAFGVAPESVATLRAISGDPAGREAGRKAILAGIMAGYTGRAGAPGDWLRSRHGVKASTEASRRREDGLAAALGRLRDLPLENHPGRFGIVDAPEEAAAGALAVGTRWADPSVDLTSRALAFLEDAVLWLPSGTGAGEGEVRAATRGKAALRARASGGALAVDRRSARVAVLSAGPSDQDRYVAILLEWTDGVFREAAIAAAGRRQEAWERGRADREGDALDARDLDDVVL